MSRKHRRSIVDTLGKFLQKGNEETELLDPGAIESSLGEEANHLSKRDELFLGHIKGRE